MIVDVVPFNNELDLLDLRLGILAPFVDCFVISEAPRAFSGREKPLYFQDNADLFAKYSDRIVHHIVPDLDAPTTFERDRLQKDDIRRCLDRICSASDVILFSDVDEIPDPARLPAALESIHRGRMAIFAQRLFYYYVNLEEVSGRLLSITGEYPRTRPRRWLGSRATTLGISGDLTMTQWRDPDRKDSSDRIAAGGWHFSYAGSPDSDLSVDDRVRLKIADTAHQELVNDAVLARLPKRLARGKDVFGRRARFRRVPVDDTFPRFLRENLDRYRHLVLT